LDHIIAFFFFAQEVGSSSGGSEDATEAVSAGSGDGGMTTLLMLGVMLVIFYFLLIRPQQKRAKEHKQMVGGLKRGDSVITSSGIYGRVVGIEGQVVTLEIAKNTHVRVLRHFVGGVANENTEKQLQQNPQ
jgi:preprotein translocase subunit YajC